MAVKELTTAPDDPRSSLEGILESCNASGKDEGITPLMVVCDRKELHLLNFIVATYNHAANEWGNPLDMSSASVGGNSAIHHAAMSGFGEAIPILCTILEMSSSAADCRAKTMLRLLSQTNAHRDTPLMMACVGGHVNFLSAILSEFGGSQNTYVAELRRLLRLSNQSGDTSISLAVGHGRVNVLEFLLSVTGMDIIPTYDDIQLCQVKVTHLEDSLGAFPSQSDDMKRMKDVKRCLVTLKVAHAKSAEKAMVELLDAEPTSLPKAPTKAMRLPRSPDRKDEILDEERDKDVTANERNKQEGEPLSGVPAFQTLADGSVVKRGTSDSLDEPPVSTYRPGTNYHRKSFDDMLRERYRQSKSLSPTFSETIANPRHDEGGQSAIDSAMESLCLDTSMLLLSPHGMALKLSASQLEAVEEILGHQLQAVKEARVIQSRLRQTVANEQPGQAS